MMDTIKIIKHGVVSVSEIGGRPRIRVERFRAEGDFLALKEYARLWAIRALATDNEWIALVGDNLISKDDAP